MQRKLIAIGAVFALFFVAGFFFHAQRGLYWDDQFWTLKKDGAYISSGGDRICFSPDEGFLLTLAKKDLTAQLQRPDDQNVRISFSDGLSMEREFNPAFGISSIRVGDVFFTYGVTYIIDDVDALDLRFAAIDRTEMQPFYDESGVTIGEAIYTYAVTDELIDFREIFYHMPEHSDPERTVIVLRDGLRFNAIDTAHTLFTNEAGEYLLNPEMLAMLPISGAIVSRGSLFNLMLSIAEGEIERRGHPAWLVLYTFVYAMGALGFLFPEKMAFFGLRWKFKSEPELSDEGLLMTQISNLSLMALSVFILFFFSGMH